MIKEDLLKMSNSITVGDKTFLQVDLDELLTYIQNNYVRIQGTKNQVASIADYTNEIHDTEISVPSDCLFEDWLTVRSIIGGGQK